MLQCIICLYVPSSLIITQRVIQDLGSKTAAADWGHCCNRCNRGDTLDGNTRLLVPPQRLSFEGDAATSVTFVKVTAEKKKKKINKLLDI